MSRMEYSNVYFIGIGGIGMSALARFFMHEGKLVAGYDRVPTKLTVQLSDEGASIHFEEDAELIPEPFRDKSSTLVVYTPAVPQNHAEMEWFRRKGFRMVKRSQMLGILSADRYVMAVAGTHGKTTTSTLLAWLNHEAARGGKDPATGQKRKGGSGGGSAFLGGISVNFGSNMVLGEGKRLVAEADEFDRSFLQLAPDAAIITSADPDHLDIYGTAQAFREAFAQFVRQIKPAGTLVIKKGVNLVIDNPQIDVYTYAVEEVADFHVRHLILLEGGRYSFDLVMPDRVIEDCTLGVPGRINVENAVAACALMWVAGFDEIRLRDALAAFRGVKRRFELYVDTPTKVYIDDYAHHPDELRAAIGSIRGMFPGREITAVFQPHLYTRTRDFHEEFAGALSLADKVILMPIYPARELPIEGVDSELIARDISVPCTLVEREEIVNYLSGADFDVLVTFGAGDIDNFCLPIAEMVRSKQ